MFRNNRKYKGILCSHKSCTTIDEFLSLIPSSRIQEYDGGLESYHDVGENEITDSEKIVHPRIQHHQFLSKEQYFLDDTFDDEQLKLLKKDKYYKYNIYIMEFSKANGIFITAPYWEIISEINQIITERLKGRILYCYVASERLIKKISDVDMDGRLKLTGGSFHVGGASKISNIQLRGANILKTNEFSFIFDNPDKYVSTEVRLRYTKGIYVRTSLFCETTGRFLFHHPKKSRNLEYMHKIIEYLVENKLLIKTEIKPFKIKHEGVFL